MTAIRPPSIGDVVAVARAVLAAPPQRQAGLPDVILVQAAAALRWHLVTGRPHPVWGTGSLMSAAMRLPLAAEPALLDRGYRQALVAVLNVFDKLDGMGGAPFASDASGLSVIVPADGGADHG